MQLIQIKDRTHLWAHEYDRELRDILALQSEISLEVADEIQLVLGDHKNIVPQRARTSSPNNDEAFDLYLRGRYFWNKRTIEGFQQAITYFQQAVSKDPNYARAYAGIADSYSLLGGYRGVPQEGSMAKARAAAQHALQLDDNLPEAQTALALIVQNYDHDWETAEKEFRRAIDEIRTTQLLIIGMRNTWPSEVDSTRRLWRLSEPGNWIRCRSSSLPIAASCCTTHGNMIDRSISFAQSLKWTRIFPALK